ncbi:MAG: TonB-dependent receptor [Pseudomonadota bacterium]
MNPVTGQEFDFDPEFTWNYELARRSQWLDDRLTVNAIAFYLDWSDQQISVGLDPNVPLSSVTLNSGESRTWGGELEIWAEPVDGLSLFGPVAYASNKFKDLISGGQQLAGNGFPYAPEWSTAFGADYFFDNGVFIGADASYQSASFDDIQNTIPIDSRFLVNARAGYETENWGVFACVTNLFDADYITCVTGPDLVSVGDPRQFGVVGQVRF